MDRYLRKRIERGDRSRPLACVSCGGAVPWLYKSGYWRMHCHACLAPREYEPRLLIAPEPRTLTGEEREAALREIFAWLAQHPSSQAAVDAERDRCDFSRAPIARLARRGH